jgi:hypothetical protein
MPRVTATTSTLCWVLLATQVAAGQAEPPKTPPTITDAPAVDPKGYGSTSVRQRKGWRNDGCQYHGVVESIDKEKMVIVGKATPALPQTEVFRYTLYPIDVLAAGKVLPDVVAFDAYRWDDVKVGDTVNVQLKEDTEELRRYVCTIQIFRRQGGKLPPSQDMKDPRWFEQANIYNDIDNGLDATDEDIIKAFPAKWHTEPGELPKLLVPGGLPEEYRKKLIAVRGKIAIEKEKNDGGLKATPPDKKK